MALDDATSCTSVSEITSGGYDPKTGGMEASPIDTIDVSLEGDCSLLKRTFAPPGSDLYDADITKCIKTSSTRHGTRKPMLGDSVTCHYRGRVVRWPPPKSISTGAAAAMLEAGSPCVYFDDSFASKQPLTFMLGVDPVIKGWAEVLQTMTAGEHAEVFIAPHKAYGSRGRSPHIPPNAWLCFELLLLAVETSGPTSNQTASATVSQDQPSANILPSSHSPTPASKLPSKENGDAKDVSGGLGCVWKLAQSRNGPSINLMKKPPIGGSGHDATPEDLSQVALEILVFAPRSEKNASCSLDMNLSTTSTNGSCSTSSSSRSCAQATINEHASVGTTNVTLGLEGMRGVAEFTVDNGCLNQWDILDWCAKALTRGETGDFLVKVPNSATIQASSTCSSNNEKQAAAAGNTDITNDDSELKFQALPRLDALIHDGVLTQAERCDPSSPEALSLDEMSAVEAAQAALRMPFKLVTSTSEDSKESQELIFVRATLVTLDKYCGRKPVKDMSTLEKITRAVELRNDGNDRFAKGAYERASRRYSAALNLISVDQGYSITERRAVRSEGLLCFLNRSLCSLKTQQPGHAKRDADFALGIEAGNVKGLFRRGAALLALERWAEARNDLRTVVAAEPTNKAAARLLRQAKAKAQEEDAKARQVFQGAFRSTDQEQSEEGKASSSASHTNDENGKEARKKKQGMLLYEDKDKTSRAREEDPDSSTNEGHPLRFKGIRAVNGKMAVVEATVPADSSAGDTFDWLLPGSHGAVASVTVPAGAKGGDRVDLEVSMDDLGRLESIDDDNDVGEEEKPLTGPLPGLGKAYKPPPSSAWFTVACMGFGLLVLSRWPFVVHLSCKGTQNLRGEGSGNIQHAESEVLLRFLGFAFLAIGSSAMADSHWNQNEFSEVYTATTFALALPTASMSLARVAAFIVSNLAALPNSIASADVNFDEVISALHRPVVLRMAVGFATSSVVFMLAPFLGGWKALASYAVEKAQGSASFRRRGITKKLN